MKQEPLYDVIIIGGSYAGLAAAMALGRALRKVLVIDSRHPANQQTPYSHNFLTQDGNSPAEISHIAQQQVNRYDTVTLVQDQAISATAAKRNFMVQTVTGKRFTASKIILATGIHDLMPDIPGLTECWGISVLHCPYCHGYEIRNKKTGILANGDTAYELAALISNWTNDLTIFTNGPATFSAQQQDVFSRYAIKIIPKAIDQIEHTNGYIQHIAFSGGIKERVAALYTRLPFVQHSGIAKELGCELTSEGYIMINPQHQTSLPSVYACGDNSSKMRTVANAVAMGTATGMMVNKALIDERFR